MSILKNTQIIGRYTVISLIKENLYTETYCVEDEDHNRYFLKLYLMSRLPEKLQSNAKEDGVLEIVYSKKLQHKNLISFVDAGLYEATESACQYYVTNYFNGTLLTEAVTAAVKLTEQEAVAYYKGIVTGLQHMHKQGICHNDITPRNIMLSQPTDEPQIIDLGHTSTFCRGKVPFDVADLDVLYAANETFAGFYDEQSDLFSATAVLYYMLTGDAPWKMEFKEGIKRSRRAMQLKEFRKENPLQLDTFSEGVQTILQKGLALSAEERYKDIEEVQKAIEVYENPSVSVSSTEEKPQGGGRSSQKEEAGVNAVDFQINRGGGGGFKDIAGMATLKDYLNQRVIFVIKNKEKVAKYKLTPPNGMLLYGPPGCGKTFVAEKFAEETGFNYILVKSSDLASSYVHGSQEKIAQLFKQAEKQAPVVICFDEFDALVPDRSNPAAQYASGEVNEFLSQLNNCSQRGIFVVGTTNRPDKIDPAVLRTGRIDKQVYVPLPDKEARKEMFSLHLAGRPYDAEGVDFDRLSELSEGFIASDIAYVVNDAAMVAAFTDREITEELLETTIKSTHPSLRKDTLKIYEEIRDRMERTERSNLSRPRIGFVQY